MDLYEILSINYNASSDEITKAYRKLAKIYHPDKPTGDTEKFQQLNYAYNILINEKTKIQYDTLKKTNKGKLTAFLEEWFKKQKTIREHFNINDNLFNTIINNIECYDFNDILNIFSKNKIPTKTNTFIDCSESDTPYWDEFSAEYYDINNLPLKYHLFNKNNIKLDLKCTIEEIEQGNIRKIKIKRKQNEEFIETSFYFKCSHPYVVFNNGGDNDGHLIILLSLPYQWNQDNIIINIDINLYQYIYGVNLEKFKIKNYIPYKEGNIINLKYVDKYMLQIKLNVIYIDNNSNKEILENFNN
jgi:DnaJ-class molecular chaperone